MQGVAYKDFLGTADYSVGDPPATHVRELGLSSKYSLFISSPALLATGWPFSYKKPCFLGVKKGVFGPFLLIFAHFRPFECKNSIFKPNTPFLAPKKHVFFLDEIGHPVANSAGTDIKRLYFELRPSPRT